MKPHVKKSNERVKTLEENIWKGIQAGIEATGGKATVPEINDVLIRFAYQYNKRNLEYSAEQVAKLKKS